MSGNNPAVVPDQTIAYITTVIMQNNFFNYA